MSRRRLQRYRNILLFLAASYMLLLTTPYIVNKLRHPLTTRSNTTSSLTLFVFGGSVIDGVVGEDRGYVRSDGDHDGGNDGDDNDLLDAVARRASDDRYIILAMVDEAFTDMAVNLYETSFRANKIKNFVFVGAGREACKLLLLAASRLSSVAADADLTCVNYKNTEEARKRSLYMSRTFNNKMKIRTDMILEVLAAGYTVLHTDLDVFFFTNPLPDIKLVMENVDVAAMWDDKVTNAGFVVIKPTRYSKQLYNISRNLTASSLVDDQLALNSAIRQMKQIYGDLFHFIHLDTNRYSCGVVYFEKGDRLFSRQDERWIREAEGRSRLRSVEEDERLPCLVVHNNWIVSYEAKVYRFKEHHMWLVDNDGYYSDATQKYLTYDFIEDTCAQTVDSNRNRNQKKGSKDYERHIAALRTALTLGNILNRVVILPRFHCLGKRPAETHSGASSKLTYYDCPLNSFINIEKFDAEFNGRYRESSFFTHPLVPPSVKLINSSLHFNPSSAHFLQSDNRNITKLEKLSSDDVISSFGDVSETVMMFRLLCNAPVPKFIDDNIERWFDQKVKNGLQPSNYRQYPERYYNRL